MPLQELLTPLILAVLLGGVIGLEREFHGRPAGLRTHTLVCLSCAMLVTGSRALGEGLDSSLQERLVFDPNRISAGIITGVGFLGAASVIRSGDLVRGITTAACIWFVAGLGVVIGQGHYDLAAAGTAIAFAVLVIVDPLTSLIPHVRYRRLVVHASTSDVEGLSSRVEAALKEKGIRVQERLGSVDTGEGTIRLVFHLRLRGSRLAPTVMQRLPQLEGVQRVQWSSQE